MEAELQHYFEALEELHRRARKALEGLPPAALNWRPVEGRKAEPTNSLAVLVAHMAGGEKKWLGKLMSSGAPKRNRPGEFRFIAKDRSELLALLDAADQFARQVLTSMPAERLEDVVQVGSRRLTLRWCALHAVQHTALHLGHLELTAQMWRSRKAIGDKR